jgi:hypothetical protein
MPPPEKWPVAVIGSGNIGTGGEACRRDSRDETSQALQPWPVQWWSCR